MRHSHEMVAEHAGELLHRTPCHSAWNVHLFDETLLELSVFSRLLFFHF